MDAWQTLEDMAARGRLSTDQLDAAARLVRSASVAGLAAPRRAVAGELVERITAGASVPAALADIEDLIVIQHHRMLVETGCGRRRAHERDDVVVELRSHERSVGALRRAVGTR